MTISQYETNNTSGSHFDFFDIDSHQTIYDEPWEYTDTDEVFYGVRGMQQTPDQIHGRWLRLGADLYGFETEALLRSALNTLASYTNQLKGPLIINGEMTYNNCVFKGYQLGRPVQYLVGSSPGWAALDITLHWRQLKP